MASQVAVAQMTSTGTHDQNLAVCRDLAIQAGSRGCQILFLPECCAFIGANQQEASHQNVLSSACAAGCTFCYMHVTRSGRSIQCRQWRWHSRWTGP